MLKIKKNYNVNTLSCEVQCNLVFISNKGSRFPQNTIMYNLGKNKGNVHPRMGHGGPEGKQRYSSMLSPLDVGG